MIKENNSYPAQYWDEKEGIYKKFKNSMMEDIHKVIQLKQKLEKHKSVIGINSNRNEDLPTVHIYTLQAFMDEVDELSAVEEISHDGTCIDELRYEKEGVILFVLMDAEKRKSYTQLSE